MKTTLKIKDIEIDIPTHMSSLSQSFLDSLSKDDINTRIIACGVDPRDKSLCFVTVQLDTRIIRPNSRYLPKIANPSIDGLMIEIEFENVEGVHQIHHRLAYDNSESCLDLADLYVGDTYISQFKFTEADAGHEDNNT